MPVGVQVPGYGLLNEYGEITFTPAAVGSRAGAIKLLKEEEGYTISTTKNKIIIHMRFDKDNGLSLLSKYLKVSNEILLTLKEYEF